MKQFDDLTEELIKNDIKPSVQRIKILEYMQNCHDHPTADQLYNALKQTVHSLSKATVYNTLTLFAEKGLVRVLTLENTENRYDIITANHGHFLCETCGRIADFEINIESFKTAALNAYKIHQKDVFFKGVCPECLSKSIKEGG